MILLLIESLREKYAGLDGEILIVNVTRPAGKPLGLMLAGDKDSNVQTAYVASIDSHSIIAKKKLLRVGDQIIEVLVHLL